MRLRVALVVKSDLADVAELAQRGQVVHNLDAGVIHLRVADKFRGSGLFNQRHVRAADDGIHARKRARCRHDPRDEACVHGVDEHALIALHDQRAVFTEEKEIVGIRFKVAAERGILPAAGDAEDHALFSELRNDFGQFGRQTLLAVQQRAVHVAGNQFDHISKLL